VTKGQGAPEIDIFEAERDKDNPTGQVTSQSAKFAPFSHDYVYPQLDTPLSIQRRRDRIPTGVALCELNLFFFHLIGFVDEPSSISQHAVSGRGCLPGCSRGRGRNLRNWVCRFLVRLASCFDNLCYKGFEYWANPSNPGEGYITWTDDKQKSRLQLLPLGMRYGSIK
jgi:hypothetical protein